jgi:hypothetical protein
MDQQDSMAVEKGNTMQAIKPLPVGSPHIREFLNYSRKGTTLVSPSVIEVKSIYEPAAKS